MPAGPSLRDPNRLFVALDLDERLRAALADVGAAVSAGTGARAVPAPNLHVTVAFLGVVDPARGEALVTGLAEAMDGPAGRVRIARVVARPRSSAARLVAVELDDVDGAVTSVAWRIRAAAERLGVVEPERRPFWPHVTVARFRRPEHVRRFPAVDDEHVFDIDRASLYDSHIEPGRPPRYRALMTVRLGGSLAERSSSHG